MTKERGFACVALDNPKSDSNIGGAMRAAQVFGAHRWWHSAVAGLLVSATLPTP